MKGCWDPEFEPSVEEIVDYPMISFWRFSQFAFSSELTFRAGGFPYSVEHMVVSSPDPTPKGRKGSGDIGADSWFCKLSNHVIICIGLYWSTCSHVMVRTTKKRPPMSPDPFLACVMGSGNETSTWQVKVNRLKPSRAPQYCTRIRSMRSLSMCPSSNLWRRIREGLWT